MGRQYPPGADFIFATAKAALAGVYSHSIVPGGFDV